MRHGSPRGPDRWQRQSQAGVAAGGRVAAAGAL